MMHCNVKEERTTEQDEEEYRGVRLRWRALDAEKARHIAEVHAHMEAELARRRAAAKELAAFRAKAAEKREVVWAARDSRVKRRWDSLIERARSLIPERKRNK